MNGFIHYPDVDEILVVLLSAVQKVLGDQFVGMYLYGSLSSGDFDPRRSDIDFLVVTRAELPDETIDNLAAMHRQIAGKSSKWAKKLEGSYIPRSALRRYDPANSRHPTIGVDWEFGVNPHGSDWIIQRHIIREQGVVLTGPSPKELIDPVSAEEIVRAVRETLQGWWSHQLRNPALLKTSGVPGLCRPDHVSGALHPPEWRGRLKTGFGPLGVSDDRSPLVPFDRTGTGLGGRRRDRRRGRNGRFHSLRYRRNQLGLQVI